MPQGFDSVGPGLPLGSQLLKDLGVFSGQVAAVEAVGGQVSLVKRNAPLSAAGNGADEWAAPDSNWRLLPCEDSALTN